jgi:hypothetical protein
MLTSGSDLPEQNLLKTLLQPLLEDFQYWFARSRTLLENHRIDFLSPEAQMDLLDRVTQAQQEVNTVQVMFHATDGRAGVETAVLLPWHKLVTECWQVGMKYRMEHPEIAALERSEPDSL